MPTRWPTTTSLRDMLGPVDARLSPMKGFRILRSVIPLLLVILGASWGQPAKHERRKVFDYLSELTGKEFKKCGAYTVGLAGWEESQKRVLDCAVAATKEPEPFYFLESGFATDSVYFHGWVKITCKYC